MGLAACLAVWSIWGCAGTAAKGGAEERNAAETSQEASAGSQEAAAPAKKFQEPGDLDKLLDAKPIALAAVKPASQAAPSASGTAKAPEAAVAKGKGNFRIQVGAESDLDAAQSKKAEYEKLLGGPVDVVFDAPYYKLRWGYFETKQDAEDKILELSDYKIQGFVVKQ
jgi:septal ring-binding cell division protein DamX